MRSKENSGKPASPRITSFARPSPSISGLEHATLFQVSTSTALVEGIYKGAVSIGKLREHGDFGLGTFEGLDGEMVAFDGHFYQVRSDGTVRLAADSDLSPFAAVTHFEAQQSDRRGRVSRVGLTAYPVGRPAGVEQCLLRNPRRWFLRLHAHPRDVQVGGRHAAGRGGGPSAGIQDEQRRWNAGRLLVARLCEDPRSPWLPSAFHHR